MRLPNMYRAPTRESGNRKGCLYRIFNMYKKTELSNGLRIVTHEIKDRESIAIGLWIGAGGRHEEDKIKGAAHFLEHIVFKGSKKYACEQIKEKIEGIGGALNAFTSEEQTCFYAKIPSKHLNQTFDVLADMVLNPTIATKDVNKEKTVIIEEIKMYHDLSQYYVLELLDGLLWPDHPLGRNLAGTQHTISQMTRKDLKGFHDRCYAPGNVVVAVCGNLKHEQIVRLVKKNLGSIQKKGQWPYVRVDNKQSQARTKFQKRNIEQMHLALGMPGFHEAHKDRYVLSLLSIILGGNMSSRLFVEVREKRGLAYSIGCSSKTLHDTGLFMVRAGVDNKKIVDAVALILKELKKVKLLGVTRGEFTRAKDYLLGQLLLGLEDTMDHMLWIGEAMVAKNSMHTLSRVIKDFERIKMSDIKRVAKAVLDENKYNLAVVGPIEAQQEEKLNRLLGLKG